MKKQILFLLVFNTQTTLTMSPFEKTIKSFQESKDSVTETDWLTSIKTTDEKTLTADLTKYHRTMLGSHAITQVLLDLAYYKSERTKEHEKLQNIITRIILDKAWEQTTFTSTVQSISIALNAQEVLNKTVPQQHQLFLKYFYRVDKQTTQVKCPLHKKVPVHIRNKALELIVKKVNEYERANIETVLFWSQQVGNQRHCSIPMSTV